MVYTQDVMASFRKQNSSLEYARSSLTSNATAVDVTAGKLKAIKAKYIAAGKSKTIGEAHFAHLEAAREEMAVLNTRMKAQKEQVYAHVRRQMRMRSLHNAHTYTHTNTHTRTYDLNSLGP